MNSLLSDQTERLLETLDSAVAQLCENCDIAYTAAPTEIFSVNGNSVVRLRDEESAFQAIIAGVISAAKEVRDWKENAAPDPVDASTFLEPIAAAVQDLARAFYRTAPIVPAGVNCELKSDVAGIVSVVNAATRATVERLDEFKETYDHLENAEKKVAEYRRDIAAVRRVFGQI